MIEIVRSKLLLGRLYMLMGAASRAEPLLLQAVAGYEREFGPTSRDVSLPLEVLADLYVRQGEYARAEPILERCLKLNESGTDIQKLSVADVRTNLAEVHEARGDVAGAEALYEKARATREAELSADHPTVASSLYDLAELHRRARDAAKAEPLYTRAIAIYKKALGDDHLRTAEALEGLAALEIGAGRVDDAIRDQTSASEAFEHNISLVLAVGSEAEKRDFLATLLSSTDFTVSLHAQSAPKLDAAERLALTVILQRKGRVLDVMADTLAGLRRRMTGEDKDLLDDLMAARSRFASAALRGPATQPLDEFLSDLKKMENEVRKLESKLSTRGASLWNQDTPVSIERVQAAIPDGSVLVELFIYRPRASADKTSAPRQRPPRYVAYTLTPLGKTGFVDLGETAPIDAIVSRFRKALGSPSSADVKAIGRELDEKIMRPVRGLLGGSTKVLLSPDGQLNVVPFAALVDEGGRYLVERYEITYLSSGRDLLRLQLQTPAKSAALVMANPAFGRATSSPQGAGSAADAPLRASALGKAVFSQLPGTASEGRALAGILQNSTLKVDIDATEAALKQAESPRIVHIATHGFFLGNQRFTAVGRARGLVLDAEREAAAATAPVAVPAPGSAPVAASASGSAPVPVAASASGSAAPPPPIAFFENPLLRSGLAFAGANGRKSGDDDGILTALEATGLNLSGTRLVVLSACETGLGDVQDGEGVYGMRRAFVIAGAETQVSSLWKVADVETKELMVSYYGKLQGGGGRSSSMRDVQLAMLAEPRSAHPYYWAAFLVSGAPSPLDSPGAGAGLAAGGASSNTSNTKDAPGKVTPGARGCACDLTRSSGNEPLGGLALFAAAWAASRRRGARTGARVGTQR